VRAVGRWDGVAWHQMGATATSVDRLLVLNDQLFASGYFQSLPSRKQVMRWDGGEWQALGAFTADATAVGVFNGQLVAAANGVYLWTGNAWQPLGGPGGGTYNNQVSALAQYGDLLVAGGNFHSPQFLLASWNGVSWQQLGTPLADQFQT